MIQTAENLRCRMRLGTVSLAYVNLCHSPHPARQEWLEITINKSGEFKKMFLCKHDCCPVGKTPGKPFADQVPGLYKIKGGIHYTSISECEGEFEGVTSVHHLKPYGNYKHHLV